MRTDLPSWSSRLQRVAWLSPGPEANRDEKAAVRSRKVKSGSSAIGENAVPHKSKELRCRCTRLLYCFLL